MSRFTRGHLLCTIFDVGILWYMSLTLYIINRTLVSSSLHLLNRFPIKKHTRSLRSPSPIHTRILLPPPRILKFLSIHLHLLKQLHSLPHPLALAITPFPAQHHYPYTSISPTSHALGRPKSTSAPASSNKSTMAVSSLNTAPASGLCPLSFIRFGSAPCRSSKLDSER